MATRGELGSARIDEGLGTGKESGGVACARLRVI